MPSADIDKFYTPDKLVKYVISRAEEVFGDLNRFDFILEPSAGAGAFLNHLPEKSMGIDILPDREDIIQMDFLQEFPDYYIENSLIIGNPPFGVRGKLFRRFLDRACKISDNVVFICPIGWVNKQQKGMPTVITEFLTPVKYSGIRVVCGLNVYSRSFGESRKFIKRIKLKCDIYAIQRGTSNEFKSADLYICGYGTSRGYITKEWGKWCNMIGVKFSSRQDQEIFENVFPRLDKSKWIFANINANFTITHLKEIIALHMPYLVKEVEWTT